MLLFKLTKNRTFNMITVNGKQKMRFGEALLHVVTNHLQDMPRHSKVLDYHHTMLVVETESPSNSLAGLYTGPEEEMFHLLQLADTMMDVSLENVPMSPVFMKDRYKWEHLQGFKGQNKICMALAYLGGMEFHFHDDSVPICECGFVKLCIAYALHVEDPRVSMEELLYITEPVKA